MPRYLKGSSPPRGAKPLSKILPLSSQQELRIIIMTLVGEGIKG
jgi:hypothetical protein